ncbi:hypothetical protein D0T90_05380 [Neisseria animalis]|uniref:Uncharacterized protein n=1 Tax=Neisseria animalis TaxID=492 RepID=A0A5P3MQW5_NEIAN|nr:hypothetical protein D0T90_05380 [Neisseria animalis]ROW32563.1 hypothetical protein CGZ60_03720 [Neisseria animalis]
MGINCRNGLCNLFHNKAYPIADTTACFAQIILAINMPNADIVSQRDRLMNIGKMLYGKSVWILA